MKPSISSLEAKIVKNILHLFDKNSIERLSRQTGFIKRSRKLSVFAFVVLMVLETRKVHIESLNELSIQLGHHGVCISRQGIDFRFTEAAAVFMKELSSKFLLSKLGNCNSLNQANKFNRIMIKDSTAFQLPSNYSSKYAGSGGSASSSGIKFQYEYDLKGDMNIGIDVQDANRSDSKSVLKNIQAMDLCLEDLGYFKLNHFEDIINKGAYFLSRLKCNITLFSKGLEGYKRINIDKRIAKIKTGDSIRIAVFLGNKEKIPVDLILERVPDKISAEKRRRLKEYAKRKGKKLSKERLAFCDVNAYITNADSEMLPIALVRSIYSLRWQIEIIFKTWKSTFNINKIKPMKIERFECITYGTLIKIILCTKLFNYYKTTIWNKSNIELSELKSFKYLLTVIESMKVYLQMKEPNLIKKLLIDTARILSQKCKKECKKDKETPMMILSKFT